MSAMRLSTIVGVCFFGTAGLLTAKQLNVPFHPQSGYFWCWAASAQMVMETHGRSVSQSQQALDKYDGACPTQPNGCDKPGWPSFSQYGFTSKNTTNTALTWNELKKEIDEGRPFCFTIKYTDDAGGHMMVVKGYTEIENIKWVIVNDPAPINVGRNSVAITFEQYRADASANPPYSHWDDYYDIH